MKITQFQRATILSAALLLSSISFSLPHAWAGGGHAHDEEGEEESHKEKEGTVEITPEALVNAGVTIETANPEELNVTLQLTGKLIPNEDKVAHVVPRFPGVIREVRKRLGDKVEKGDILAVIESNSTIQRYEVQSLLSGVITKRHATLGEYAGEASELFVVSDYGELFADFFVYPTDSGKIALGQKVFVSVPGRSTPIESTVSFISPIVDTDNQSRFVRVVVPNEDGKLQPGSFVSSGIVIEHKKVSTAILNTALQNIEGKTKVFIQDGDDLVAQEVSIGSSDLRYSEVLAGVSTGQKYAAGNTFILKADLGKSEAEHEH